MFVLVCNIFTLSDPDSGPIRIVLVASGRCAVVLLLEDLFCLRRPHRRLIVSNCKSFTMPVTDFYERLRQFDAYPKTLEDFRVKTYGGAIGKLLAETSHSFHKCLPFHHILHAATESTVKLNILGS